MEGERTEHERELGAIRVLHEDNHLLVVDKPAGLLTQAAAAGDDNLLDRCKAYIGRKYKKPGNVYLGLVHRLDRNVSGVVILARTSKAAARLTKAFQDRTLEKRYLAVVLGAIEPSGRLIHRLANNPKGRGVVESNRGKEARLSYTRKGRSKGCSLVEIELETGRKHQIRAQFSLAGHPLFGDPLYGTPAPDFRRPALLAYAIAFDHPVGGKPLRCEATLPEDLSQLLKRHAFLERAIEMARGLDP